MITDGFVEEHEDVDLNTSEFRLKDVVRIITGMDVLNVQHS